MSTTQPNTAPPVTQITFPTEVTISFTFKVDNISDLQYLTSSEPENSIRYEAYEIFENVNLECIAVNNVPLVKE